MSVRLIAVDWSGALVRAERKIWLAEATPEGELVRLESGRDRAALTQHLIDESRGDAPIVAGLDFGFALPEWYMRELGCATAPGLWSRLAAGDAERWLRGCEPPFWGRPGRGKPALGPHFRRTEDDVAFARGVRPKSVFQIGGAGAVGTGSLRGMCALHRLRSAGWTIWPFEPAGRMVAIEIYPRLFTGPVVKSDAAQRARFLAHPPATLGPRLVHSLGTLPATMRDRAAASEDAFDAAVSALAMAEHAAALTTLPRVRNPQLRLEGAIWHPAWREASLAQK